MLSGGMYSRRMLRLGGMYWLSVLRLQSGRRRLEIVSEISLGGIEHSRRGETRYGTVGRVDSIYST